MAKIKKHNKNRYRKIYNFIRKKPNNEFISTENGIIEVADVVFSSDTAVTYNFVETYKTNPTVTVGSADAVAAGKNIFVSSLSTTSVTVTSSSSFTGVVSLVVTQ